MIKRSTALLSLAGLCLLLSGCAGSARNPNLPEGPVDVVYTAYDGTQRALSASRGQPAVVVMVTTWAGPALVEVQRVRAVREEFGNAFSVLVLVLDENPQAAAIFAKTFELSEEVGRVEPMQTLVGPRGPFGPITQVPTSVLLDAEGRIAVRSDGSWPSGALEKGLRVLLRR